MKHIPLLPKEDAHPEVKKGCKAVGIQSDLS